MRGEQRAARRRCRPLNVAALGEVKPEDQGRITFAAHPSVGLLRLAYPADAIWRAVLASDDERSEKSISNPGRSICSSSAGIPASRSKRLDEQSWLFLSRLGAAQPIEAALDMAGDLDCSVALGEHLASGRFFHFELAAPETFDPV